MTGGCRDALLHASGPVSRHYPFKPYHPGDSHSLVYGCGCESFVPMSDERFISLLLWPNQVPTGRRPGEFFTEPPVV